MKEEKFRNFINYLKLNYAYYFILICIFIIITLINVFVFNLVISDIFEQGNRFFRMLYVTFSIYFLPFIILFFISRKSMVECIYLQYELYAFVVIIVALFSINELYNFSIFSRIDGIIPISVIIADFLRFRKSE